MSADTTLKKGPPNSGVELPGASDYIIVIHNDGVPIVCVRGDGNVEIHGDVDKAAEIFWSAVRDKISGDFLYRTAFNAGVASIKGPLVS